MFQLVINSRAICAVSGNKKREILSPCEMLSKRVQSSSITVTEFRSSKQRNETWWAAPNHYTCATSAFLSNGISCRFIEICPGFIFYTCVIHPWLKRTKVSGLLTPSLTYSSLTKPASRNYNELAYSRPRISRTAVSKLNFVCCQIDQKTITTIQIWIDLERFRMDFSVCR